MATIACAAMIAQQVAGKAARDALFLSTLRIEHLPLMMATSAAVSLLAALGVSRLMVRYSPDRVVPTAFAVSGVLLLANWGLSFIAARPSAIFLYVHTAVFGAVVISAFWSLVNETFAFRSGRRAMRWITGGGTVGGLIGGLVAWRLAHLIRLPTMLLLLAALDVVCIWGTYRLRRPTPALPREPAARAKTPLLWRTRYLRNLAIVVALGAVTSGLLDYAFSEVAIERFAGGPQLLAFFAKFWLVVGLLSVVLETLFARRMLRKAGLAATVASLPLVVVLGCIFGVALPGLLSMVVLRGGEAAHRNSLFREAYELLYTPLSAARKRAAKTFIDVGADRVGTMLAGLVAMLVVTLCTRPLAAIVVLLLALTVALVTIVRSTPLRGGYVALLEESLREAAEGMGPEAVIARSDGPASAPPGPPSVRGDAQWQALLDVHSGEHARVRPVLASNEPLSAPLVAFTLPLLAHEEWRRDATRALVKAAFSATGQLVDALCDPRVDVGVRACIPVVLAHGSPTVAVEGLLRGIEDESFEVRASCVVALLEVRLRSPAMVVPLDHVVAVVERELGEKGTPVDLRLEQVFHVLALHLDPASMRTAFRALQQENEQVRGMAIEYLETVVPDQVCDLLWPLLAERGRSPDGTVRAPAIGTSSATTSPSSGSGRFSTLLVRSTRRGTTRRARSR